ncbi:MAG: hypothetical protein Q9211_006225, partial [Gyalolechia sp. 1 TL-2023]
VDDDEDDDDDDDTPGPALGLRGGEVPNTLRAERDLVARLTLTQELGLLPTSNDEGDEAPSLEQLRAMVQARRLQQARDALEEQTRETEREIERQLELRRELEAELARERARQEELRRALQQGQMEMARAILELRAAFLAGDMRGGSVGQGAVEEEREEEEEEEGEGDEGNEDDEDYGEIEILGPDDTYVGGRVVGYEEMDEMVFDDAELGGD